MASSESRPDSASTAQDSIRDHKALNDDKGDKEDGNPLGIITTQQEESDVDNQMSKRDSASKQVNRKPTYVKEFWKFHMRSADDDEQKYGRPS